MISSVTSTRRGLYGAPEDRNRLIWRKKAPSAAHSGAQIELSGRRGEVESEAPYRRGPAMSPEKMQGVLDAAQMLAGKGKKPEAFAKYKEVLESDPAHAEGSQAPQTARSPPSNGTARI